jgi:hypothetical protein
LIFLQLQRFARKQGGPAAWESLLREAQLPAKSYSPARAYPDQEMSALIAAAGRHLDLPTGAILEAFGEFIAPALIRLYGSLIDPGWKTLDLIENTERLIHAAVRVGNPGARPPVLDCVRGTPDELQLLYTSERRLCAVATGIIRGVARHYGESVRITHDACMLRGDPFCALQVTRVTAAEEADQPYEQLATRLYLEDTPPSGPGRSTPEVDGEAVPFLQPPVRGDELGRLGEFRVLDEIGRGGMGIVFRAEDNRLDRVVALKVMRPRFSADARSRQRFLREARAMAALKSDHVVTVYEVGIANDVPFLAMEFLEGESLDASRRRLGRLPLSQVVRIGKEAALGLAAAHARGLVHRDVKPSNLWLEAPTGRVKLLDFGLARRESEDRQASQPGLIVGTPAFMAPEQARGKAVDYRADLFSLGCVLYWLCTGQLPFPGTDVLSTLTALATVDPEPPEALASDVGADLSDLILSLLRKDPGRRPTSGQALADALSAIELGSSAAPAR